MFKNEALKPEQELRAIIHDATELSKLTQFCENPKIKSFLDRAINPLTNPDHQQIKIFLDDLISKYEDSSTTKCKPIKSHDKDLCHLINKVHVAPKSGEWFRKTVKKVCCQNLLPVEVCSSDLDEQPRWL